MVKLILQGILLIPPDECPDFIYKMMAATWKTDPADRTSFADILDAFLINCRSCRQRLAVDGKPTERQASIRLPGDDDALTAAGGVDQATSNSCTGDGMAAEQASKEIKGACHRHQEEEGTDTYMVPVELEGLRPQHSTRSPLDL